MSVQYVCMSAGKVKCEVFLFSPTIVIYRLFQWSLRKKTEKCQFLCSMYVCKAKTDICQFFFCFFLSTFPLAKTVGMRELQTDIQNSSSSQNRNCKHLIHSCQDWEESDNAKTDTFAIFDLFQINQLISYQDDFLIQGSHKGSHSLKAVFY